MKNKELSGVHKFWFDNSEIDFSIINEHFQIQKNGWLKDKYNEKLHVRTNINRQIEIILGEEEYKKDKIKKAKKIIEELKEYLLIFKKYDEFINQDKKEKLQKIYDEQSKKIKELNLYKMVPIK